MMIYYMVKLLSNCSFYFSIINVCLLAEYRNCMMLANTVKLINSNIAMI